MNKIQLQTQRNNTRRLFKHSSGIHVNCVRLNCGNTLRHEEKKMQICWDLLKEQKQFICEAEFENGSGRADIVVLDPPAHIIEIVHSETTKSIEAKHSKYPLEIKVIKC